MSIHPVEISSPPVVIMMRRSRIERIPNISCSAPNSFQNPWHRFGRKECSGHRNSFEGWSAPRPCVELHKECESHRKTVCRHVQDSQGTRDLSAQRFKAISEAYQTLGNGTCTSITVPNRSHCKTWQDDCVGSDSALESHPAPGTQQPNSVYVPCNSLGC